MSPSKPRPAQPALPVTPVPSPQLPAPHADGTTARPETPALEGREPLPAELTGRASGTDDDLVSLFGDGSDEHLTDGFRGGSQDVPGSRETPPDDDPVASPGAPG